MRSSKAARHLGIGLLLCFSFTACEDKITGPSTQGGSPTSSPTPTATPNPTASGSNVMSVTVNGSLCGASQYANEPCVSVTLCQPGTSNCQTIDNILLDTGSYGLRIYKSLITVPLTPIATGGKSLAECVGYGDGSSDWGPVEMASVKLGDEPAVQVPIQAIDSSYATPPSQCTSSQSTPDTGPSETGFGGILGLGFYAQDCGTYCASTANNTQYYACTGSVCSPSTASQSNQLTNPVSLLPVDNNGVLISFPSVSATGATSVSGSVIFGIGTQSNNTANASTVLGASSQGEFNTVFSAYSSSPIPGFIDTGSSLYFFPPPTANQLPDCNTTAGGNHGTSYAGIFCPSSTVSLSATTQSSTTSGTGTIAFQIANGFTQLTSSTNSVFPALGGAAATGTGAYFDFGLPFHFGRTVYVGIENTQSSLGTGPLWAY